MGKLVVLKLDGDLNQQGFRVTLEIGGEGERPEIEMTGNLPPDPELATHLQRHWQEKYRRLGAPYGRFQPLKDGSDKTQRHTDTQKPQQNFPTSSHYSLRVSKNLSQPLDAPALYRITPQQIIYDGSVNDRFHECRESAKELSDRLKAWLDSEPFRNIDRRLREELNRDEVIRLLIRTKDEHLQKLPWHLWDFFERYPKAEVALSTLKCQRLKKFPTTTRKEKVRILAILGHSEGINIESDRQLLEKLPNAETVFLVEPQHQQINDYLWEQPWDIIFFAGHSETSGDTGRIYINPTDSLTIKQLGFALKKAVDGGLKLAIFNSCDGLGLARQLDDLQIPQMIVMRELVPDQVAQEFLKYFLTAFANGKSLYLAVRQARERLEGLESKFPCASWLPVICQHPADRPPTWEELLEKPVDRVPPWRSLQKVLLASVVVTSLVMGMRSLGLFQPLELKSFDYLMQLRPAEKPDSRLLIVKVTAEDIKKLGGEYPLSDRTMLRLLKKLDEYQPRVIGIDIYRDRPEGEGHADLVKYLQKSERIISVCTVPSTKIPDGVAPPPGLSGEKLGFGDVVPDPDGIVRRHLLAMKPPAASSCSTYYALSFGVALRYLEAESILPQYISENDWKLGTFIFKKLSPNTGFYHRQVGMEGFQVLLNYRSNQSPEEIAEQVTLTDVFRNRVKSDFVKDKVILIGITDPSVKDDLNTPYNQEIRGLLIHAQMVSQILSAVKEQRSLLGFSPLWIDAFFVWFWSVVGGLVTLYFLSSPLRFGLTSGIAIITINGICVFFLLTKGSLLPLVPSMLALMATTGSIVAYRASQSQQYKKYFYLRDR